MVCFLVYFLPPCLGKDCRWLLRVHGITNWPELTEGLKNQTHRGEGRGGQSEQAHQNSDPGGWSQALQVEKREAGTSFPSFSLPVPLFPAAAEGEGPQPSEELDFLKCSHSNPSEKLNRRLLVLVAPRDQVQSHREACSGAGQLDSKTRATPHATCHPLSVAQGLLAGKLLWAKEAQATPIWQEVALQ